MKPVVYLFTGMLAMIIAAVYYIPGWIAIGGYKLKDAFARTDHDLAQSHEIIHG